MNEGDQAERAADTFLQASIQSARSAAKHRALLPRGSCYFCDEPIKQPKLFCDKDCSEDYEKLKRNNRTK